MVDTGPISSKMIQDNMEMQPRLPPGPRLTLEKFEGDGIKYLDFERRCRRGVEQVFFNYDDRIAFLESMCQETSRDIITNLSCLVDHKEAYFKA